MASEQTTRVIPVERIASRIFVIRGEKVMLDSDLAELYGVETKNLNKAVTRNRRRFPDDFMFRLTKEEWDSLRFQIGTSKTGHGGRRYPPRAFTEQGVSMLSSVLRSERAVDVNVAIMRTFVKLRRMLATDKEITRKLAQHDEQIAVLFEQLKVLLEPPGSHGKRRIGFTPQVADGKE